MYYFSLCNSSTLSKIITTGYQTLNLQYFFTCGHDEVRAWTIMVSHPLPLSHPLFSHPLCSYPLLSHPLCSLPLCALCFHFMCSLVLYHPLYSHLLCSHHTPCSLILSACSLAISHHIMYVLLHPQKHTKAPQAGGKIHTDFEKGFIMAEVCSVY